MRQSKLGLFFRVINWDLSRFLVAPSFIKTEPPEVKLKKSLCKNENRSILNLEFSILAGIFFVA